MGSNNPIKLMNMFNKISVVFILFVALSCAKKSDASLEVADTPPVISETIDPVEFQDKINSIKDVVILDVRTPAELANGYIEGAVNIDFKAADFQTKINNLDKDATYLVYCAGGGRSRSAANLMKDLKFKVVYDLKGGFSQWSANGLPVTNP